MANLAIKGHATRSKEVIEILKMLGGTNSENCWGVFDNRLYSINAFGVIEDKSLRDNSNYQVYTLEEFLEKFPYKVGDKVKVKETGKDVTIDGMSWRNGCEVIYDTCYNNDCVSFYSAEELQPYKEETMEIPEKLMPKIDFNEYCKDKYILDLGNYEIKEENGKTYAVRKWLEYPKTYEECCEILSIPTYYKLRYYTYEHGYNEYTTLNKLCSLQDKLNILGKLLICRDAYWKMAGEQIGLEKPWEPDFLNDEQLKFCLYNSLNNVLPGMVCETNEILVFPTEEMRDVFYENFKDLIEKCKKLL